MKVVVQETGIKPDTLRAWERRYGLPEPKRTAGGHRLYSQYDIDLLKWLLSRLDEGLSISRAVQLWRQLEEEGKDPLLASGPSNAAETSIVDMPISGNMVAQSRQGWIDACLRYDEADAQRILSQAFALYPVELVCTEVLQKGLAEIGQGWYEGNVSVQQEHFASELAVRQLEALLATLAPATRHGRIVVACPPYEQHTFGVLMLTLLLRRRGWQVVYLGANVPLQRLQETLNTIDPHLVILSAQTLYTASTLMTVANTLQKANVLTAFGGAVFSHVPDLSKHIPGHFLGKDLQKAPQVVEALFNSASPPPPVKWATPQHEAARKHFQDHQSAIAAQVYEELGPGGVSHELLQFTNEELSQNIIAALNLGDIDLLDPNIEWIQGLLANYKYQMPEQLLKNYLRAYAAACRSRLDNENGSMLLDWFDRMFAQKG